MFGYTLWPTTWENIIVDDYDKDFVFPSFADVSQTVPNDFRCASKV